LLLEQQIDASVPSVLYGDARRVEQILSNLLGNAIKFTVNGKVGLSAWWLDEHATDGRARLVLAVSDTGIGIPATELEGIFALFQQVDASSARRVGGSGLGLAIVRHLTTLMGGRVLVESELGRGSIFTVELPLATELRVTPRNADSRG
jgi:signal transduction histidine kinase